MKVVLPEEMSVIDKRREIAGVVNDLVSEIESASSIILFQLFFDRFIFARTKHFDRFWTERKYFLFISNNKDRYRLYTHSKVTKPISKFGPFTRETEQEGFNG